MPGPNHARAAAPRRHASLYNATRSHLDGLLCFCLTMRQHRGHRAARNQLLEMAFVPMALHGTAGLAAGLRHLPRRQTPGAELTPPEYRIEPASAAQEFS